MQRSTLSLILGLLVLAPAVLSDIGVQLNYDEDLKDEFSKKFEIKGKINLKCTVTGGEDSNVVWYKGTEELRPDERRTMSASDNVHSLTIKHAGEKDAGLYECVVGDELRANITLLSRVHVKTPENLNFVEGEAIKITCQVLGKPTPTISWMAGNETYEESRDRVTLEKDPESGIENTVFIIKEAQMSDRQEYKCMAASKHGDTVETKTMVRIKDKYAALWPFLGICAEVFVLCAIILIYEKKRNKTELEESDTDQSPDQKNTPDHGKDTNLRHRQ